MADTLKKTGTDLAQTNIRRKTLMRLQFVKPHVRRSCVDIASAAIDGEIKRIVRRKHIELPADCSFSITG